MDRPLIVVDTETATSAGPPHLLELGAARVEDGEVVAHLDALVLPEVPIDPVAADVHGIEEEDLRGAAPPHEVLAALDELVGDGWMVAHGARDDARVLGFAYRRAGLDPPDAPLLDALPLAKRAFPDAPDHKLATLAEHLDLDAPVVHRALPDALACWQVLERALADEGGTRGVADAALLAACGGPRTIAAEGPRVARRLPQRLRALERACGAGDEVVLHYGEGDGTPARLPVRPRLLYDGRDHSYLEGECVLSGTLKTYRLDRIRRAEVGAGRRGK